eukprot:14623874-Alexandrium_andersonii.AAC.1
MPRGRCAYRHDEVAKRVPDLEVASLKRTLRALRATVARLLVDPAPQPRAVPMPVWPSLDS